MKLYSVLLMVLISIFSLFSLSSQFFEHTDMNELSLEYPSEKPIAKFLDSEASDMKERKTSLVDFYEPVSEEEPDVHYEEVYETV